MVQLSYRPNPLWADFSRNYLLIYIYYYDIKYSTKHSIHVHLISNFWPYHLYWTTGPSSLLRGEASSTELALAKIPSTRNTNFGKRAISLALWNSPQVLGFVFLATCRFPLPVLWYSLNYQMYSSLNAAWIMLKLM